MESVVRCSACPSQHWVSQDRAVGVRFETAQKIETRYACPFGALYG